MDSTTKQIVNPIRHFSYRAGCKNTATSVDDDY